MASTSNPSAGSTVANEANNQLTDLQVGNYRAVPGGGWAAQTTPAGDWGYASLTASGNTIVKTGAGQLHSIVCGAATGNITIYDGTTANGNVILAASALVAGVLTLDVSFTTGLFIVLSGAGVATATFR